MAFVILFAFAVSALVSGCRGGLSREQAADIISKEYDLPEPVYVYVPIGHVSISSENDDSRDWTAELRAWTLLEQLGYLRVTGQSSGAVDVTLTSKGVASFQVVRDGLARARVGEFIVEVTGILMSSDKISADVEYKISTSYDRSKIAEYAQSDSVPVAWNTVAFLGDFGPGVQSGIGKLVDLFGEPLSGVMLRYAMDRFFTESSVEMAKYDDGWRIVY